MRKQEQSVRTTHDACCRRKCRMKKGNSALFEQGGRDAAPAAHLQQEC